jgi:hypothetical protein
MATLDTDANGQRDDTSLVAYQGPSMYPTLREPDLMEVVGYKDRAIRAGDVVLFRQRATGRQVVHRVVAVTRDGLRTRGDNNSLEDCPRVAFDHVVGQVVGAWRGARHRRIAGGVFGGLYGVWAGRVHRGDRWLADRFRWLYRALSYRGWLVRMLPASWRPTVVWFRVDEVRLPRVIWRGRDIAHYERKWQRWHIERPYRFLINERELPVPTGSEVD